MTIRFINWRLALYVAVFLFSGTVLGLAGHLANVFLPNLHKDFTIFALVVPCLTIFTFLLTYQWSQPRIEVAVLFTLGILWIAMGAWSADIIGHIQCDSLGGQRTATKMGDMSAQAYCYEMKVIQAFSWANFILFVVAFLIILKLISQAQGYGRWNIWAEPIEELGWFHEYPGWYSQPSGMQQPIPYAAMGAYPQMPMAQQPAGTTLLVQPNGNQPPTVSRLPYGSAGGV